MPRKRKTPSQIVTAERPVIEGAKLRLDALLAETKALRQDLVVASKRLAKASDDCRGVANDPRPLPKSRRKAGL